MFRLKKTFHFIRLALAAVIMLLWGAAFSGMAPLAGRLFKVVPLIPALLIAGSGITVIFLLTLLTGRFYCSVCCPLGILQDLFRWLSRSKSRALSNLRNLRLAVTGICVGAYLAGSLGMMMFFDPYSLLSRSMVNCIWLLIPLIILLAACWKPRIFCNTLCPAGTLLGMASSFPLIRLSLNERCVKCGKCAGICPASSIDLTSGKVDNESCLRCMKCISSCPLPKSGISLRFIRKRDFTDLSRRKLLISGGVAVAAAAIGYSAGKAKIVRSLAAEPQFDILPPGAGNKERFAEKCTNCLLCVKNCPAKIIVPPVSPMGQISLDLTKGACLYECNLCAQLCPSQAIIPQPLALKKRTRIATAQISELECIGCGKCEDACPTGAIICRNEVPQLRLSKCIGCGACLHACPADAIEIEAVDQQLIIR